MRNSDKGAAVAAQYPKVKLVYGSLEDSEVLEAAARDADIVVREYPAPAFVITYADLPLDTADSSDHMGAALAIAKGITAGHSKANPGFWIHLSGTGILCYGDMETKTYGEGPKVSHDDWEGASKLTSLPDAAWHRDVDKAVLDVSATAGDAAKIAIICPCCIYGTGRGPGNQRSIQIYDLVKASLLRGRTIQIGAGKTEWDYVHVHDLAKLYVSLVEEAAKKNVDEELWGPKVYYLAENGHFVWGEVSQKIADAAAKAGYIRTNEVEVVSVEEAQAIGGQGAITWGANSKGKSIRARKLLGWNPTGPSLDEEIPGIVEIEARRLGLSKGHKEQVALEALT